MPLPTYSNLGADLPPLLRGVVGLLSGQPSTGVAATPDQVPAIPGISVSEPSADAAQQPLNVGMLAGMDFSEATPQAAPDANAGAAQPSPFQSMIDADKEAAKLIPNIPDFQFAPAPRAPVDISRLAAIAHARQKLGSFTR